jgi:hypothetical protein
MGGLPKDKSPELFARGSSRILEHETGFEPATLTLAKRRDRKK